MPSSWTGALETSLWNIRMATIVFLQINLKGNEGRRLTCRQLRRVDNTLCWFFHWQICNCQRIRKCPPLLFNVSDCSDTAHDINKTINIISLSSLNMITCSTLLTTQTIQNFSDTIFSFWRSHRQTGKTKELGAKLTVEAFSSIANSPSAELDTPLVNGTATPSSSRELAIADSTRDVANELLHGGSIYTCSSKNPSNSTSSLISLSASNDVSIHFQGHLEEQYSGVSSI